MNPAQKALWFIESHLGGALTLDEIAGRRLALPHAPNFERYGESFDPLTGNGGLQIWIPVRE